MINLQHVTSKTWFYLVSPEPLASDTKCWYGRVRFERKNEFPKKEVLTPHTKNVDFLKTMKTAADNYGKKGKAAVIRCWAGVRPVQYRTILLTCLPYKICVGSNSDINYVYLCNEYIIVHFVYVNYSGLSIWCDTMQSVLHNTVKSQKAVSA